MNGYMDDYFVLDDEDQERVEEICGDFLEKFDGYPLKIVCVSLLEIIDAYHKALSEEFPGTPFVQTLIANLETLVDQDPSQLQERD